MLLKTYKKDTVFLYSNLKVTYLEKGVNGVQVFNVFMFYLLLFLCFRSSFPWLERWKTLVLVHFTIREENNQKQIVMFMTKFKNKNNKLRKKKKITYSLQHVRKKYSGYVLSMCSIYPHIITLILAMSFLLWCSILCNEYNSQKICTAFLSIIKVNTEKISSMI